MTQRNYPIAVIGAGPTGMAAAAHLAERNIPFMLFEGGNAVGASLLDWAHVRLFTPWKYNIDSAAGRLLADTDWKKPNEDDLPTGEDMVKNYLLPLSSHPRVKPNIYLSSKVTSITKRGKDKMKTRGREDVPFIIKVNENGRLKSYEASGVIDASGTWNNPNPVGAGGIHATGEPEQAEHIAYRIPDILGKDKKQYANKNVVVAGGGHSALNSLLDLAALKKEYPGTRLHWVLRTEKLSSVYGGKEDDALEVRGALGIRIEELVNEDQLKIYTPYFIHEIVENDDKMNIRGYLRGKYREIPQVDEIIANTGARPDLSILREVRVQTDSALECVPGLAELIDPNVHSCGTVRPHGELELRQPEQNFYIAGVKSYGRAPTFLMATGYEQVRSIIAWLDGDFEAARRVELDLPETGVCSTGHDEEVACCSPGISEKNNEDINEGVCCSPSTDNKLNIETMEKVEKPGQGSEAASGCCGGAPTSSEDACCKLDEEKKAEGETGCGCGSTTPEPAAVASSSCC